MKRRSRLFWTTTVLSAGLATTAAAQVTVEDPLATLPVNGALPALPNATGNFPDAATSVQTPFVVHEDQFTWAADLLNLHTTNQTSWVNSLKAQPGALQFSCSPAFEGHLTAALGDAASRLGALDVSSVENAVNAFNLFLNGTLASPTGNPTPGFVGYNPVRARWLKSKWAPNGFGLQPETKRVYPDVFVFEDVRQRGARLYCAARKAQAVQGPSALSMGERPSFSINVLGVPIDFLVVGSTMAIDGPERFLGPAQPDDPPDGAQAFTVPFLLGTKITPIRGIPLPGFDEIRVPMVLVTGDSEVRTAWDRRPVLLGYDLACNPLPCRLVPRRETFHSKESHTVSHGDAMVTTSIGLSADAKVPLFTIGAAVFYLTLGLDYQVGAHDVGGDRVLSGVPLLAAREGPLFTHLETAHRYHDGPWRLTVNPGGIFAGSPLRWNALPDGLTDAFWREPLLPTLQPHDIRAITADDHAFKSNVSATLSAGLEGDLGVTAGPFDVHLTAHGDFSGTVKQSHDLRDALLADDPLTGVAGMRPITAVTMRPESEASVDFSGLVASLHFELDLFFDDIVFDKQLFKVGATKLAEYKSKDHFSDADESFAFRLGTGSSVLPPFAPALGQIMTKPAVASHLPQGNEFDTFEQDVPACLTDDTPNVPIDPPCPGDPPTGTPPAAELCLWGPKLITQENSFQTQIPLGVCGNVSGFVSQLDLAPDMSACFVNYLSFLCTPVSKTQPWEGTNVVSRVWNVMDAGLNTEFGQILNACGEAKLAATGSMEEAKAFVEELVNPGVCRAANAMLLPGEAILGAIDPTTPPPTKPGPICNN